MSKGSPIVPVRIPEATLNAMEDTIECRNANSREAPWTRSEFINIAIREKVKKMHRSRTWRKFNAARALAKRAEEQNHET